jgi:aryl-alcohol dehydrogenase-like predicted oxidoreductase
MTAAPSHDSSVNVASRIGLGTVQFGMDYGVSNPTGKVSAPEVSAILAAAEAAGIRMLDTAASYGSAEQVLGRALRPGHPFAIVTKTLPLRDGLEQVEIRARQSLEYLGTKPVDAILVHAAQNLAGSDGPRLWKLLQRLRDEGLFRRIGISAYVADRPLELARKYRPDIVQIPFSILDQRLKQTGELKSLKELGIEIHVRSIFLQGLLLMEPKNLPAKLAHAGAALAATQARIGKAGLTNLAAAIGFVLAQHEVDIAVVGVTRQSELLEILAAAAEPLPAIDWSACAIDDVLALTPSLW